MNFEYRILNIAYNLLWFLRIFLAAKTEKTIALELMTVRYVFGHPGQTVTDAI